MSYILNKTYIRQLVNFNFDSLPQTIMENIFRDGRAFSHFIEPWLANEFGIKWIKGCKGYDFIDETNGETKYIDEKTFTNNGCSYRPSNMKGVGRTFDGTAFKEKASNLIYCIVSNVNFPEIKVIFIKGDKLLELYPNGEIPTKDHDKFFNQFLL